MTRQCRRTYILDRTVCAIRSSDYSVCWNLPFRFHSFDRIQFDWFGYLGRLLSSVYTTVWLILRIGLNLRTLSGTLYLLTRTNSEKTCHEKLIEKKKKLTRWGVMTTFNLDFLVWKRGLKQSATNFFCFQSSRTRA